MGGGVPSAPLDPPMIEGRIQTIKMTAMTSSTGSSRFTLTCSVTVHINQSIPRLFITLTTEEQKHEAATDAGNLSAICVIVDCVWIFYQVVINKQKKPDNNVL